MKNFFGLLALSIVVTVSIIACDDGYLRGNVSPSSDGKTYLAIDDDNGGHCGPISVDGKVWKYKIGEAGPITSGRHQIECGGWINFDIPSGVVFRFNYWGP